MKHIRILYKSKDFENKDLKEIINNLEEKAKSLKIDFDRKIDQLKNEKANETPESHYIISFFFLIFFLYLLIFLELRDFNINSTSKKNLDPKKRGLKKSPSLFEQLAPPLQSAQSFTNNTKKSIPKKIYFASFAFSNKNDENKEIKIPNIFEYFQKPVTQINMKKEKTTEKWDPYHVFFYISLIS